MLAELVNTIGAENVTLCDPHSDVAVQLFDNVQVITQDRYLHWSLQCLRPPYTIVCPDVGARPKIDEYLKANPDQKVIYCTKVRNPETGELSQPEILTGFGPHEQLVIVDDICDGGGTFIMLAEEFKRRGHKERIHLAVTHGLFTKGFGVFYDSPINSIIVRGERVYG